MPKIYFDHAAHMLVSKQHLESITEIYHQAKPGNPSSSHSYGRSAKKLIENYRQQIRSVFGKSRSNAMVIFTSGATEGNNLIVSSNFHRIYLLNRSKASENRSSTQAYSVAITAGEHSSHYNSCVYYAQKYNLSLNIINLTKDGIIDLDHLNDLVKKHNIGYLGLFHVNHETAIINPIEKISQLVKNQSNSYIHVDGAQSFAKIDCSSVGQGLIDSYVFSGHKIGALSGCGGLYVKDKIAHPMFFGGSQERSNRAGSENLLGIISLGERIKEIKGETLWLDNAHRCYRYLCRNLEDNDKVVIHGNTNYSLQTQMCFCLKDRTIGYIQPIFDRFNISVGYGSACRSSFSSPSLVLKSMGIDDFYARNSIRVSFGADNTIDEVECFLKILLTL